MCIITLFNKFKQKNWVFTLPYLPSKVQVKIKIMLSTFFKYVVFFCLFIFSHYESILVIFPEILVTKLHAYHVIKYMSQFIHVATNNRQKYLVSLPGCLFRVCSGFCQMGSKLCEAYKLKTVQQSFFHKKIVCVQCYTHTITILCSKCTIFKSFFLVVFSDNKQWRVLSETSFSSQVKVLLTILNRNYCNCFLNCCSLIYKLIFIKGVKLEHHFVSMSSSY